jgi:hypothetical protein
MIRLRLPDTARQLCKRKMPPLGSGLQRVPQKAGWETDGVNIGATQLGRPLRIRNQSFFDARQELVDLLVIAYSLVTQRSEESRQYGVNTFKLEIGCIHDPPARLEK